MTPRAVLTLAVAGLVAAACTSGPPSEGADRGATGATEASSATDATDRVAADAEPTCRRELAELDRRDEAGTIDWEAVEGPDEEPTEQELESVMIERDDFPGDVVAPGERPTFPDFPDRLDIETLSDVELVDAVDVCYEIGVLTDEEPADDEAG